MGIIHLSLLVMLCLGVHSSSSDILQRQKRNWIIDSFTIDEGYKGKYPYSLGTIHIEKDLTIFRIHGQGYDEEPHGTLSINENTGEMMVHGPVDYERFPKLKLIFRAIDKQKNVVDTQLGVEVKIKDANDNTPKFDHERYEVSIKELTLQGTDLITIKASDSDSTLEYRTISYRIASVTPKPHDLEFYISQNPSTQTGTISFKGCLDHEKADKYTIIVEAKDHGEIQLSSTCSVIVNIEDGNNHLPVIKQQTGPGKVKEGEENVLVSRIQVTDLDSRGTAAWRAKYKILNDTQNYFTITTDPETNDGLLYVQKQLDYEESSVRSMTITVENEIPYYSCKVKARTTFDLWEVVTIGGFKDSGTTVVTETQKEIKYSSHQVTVTVEDVNEPPVFTTTEKFVTITENLEAGRYLETFTATDADIGIGGNTFVYEKGRDPANWVTVDAKTGKLTTSSSIDRESSFVKDGVYEVLIYAVDNGNPKMTGTATLSIHITDENDNVPSLVVSVIDMCQSEGPSFANITAVDLDADPYGGPFKFKLHGDVKDKWKVEPARGYSVNLVKESTVHSGYYELMLEVSDAQGTSALHNLSVTVCDCSERPNCRMRKLGSSKVGGGAAGIIFFSVLLLAGLILLALLLSCKHEKVPLPEDGSGQNLMISNTEKPGTDCAVTYEALGSAQKVEKTQQAAQLNTGMTIAGFMSGHGFHSAATEAHGHSEEYGMSQSERLLKQQQMKNLHWMVTDSQYFQSQGQSTTEQAFVRGNASRTSMGASSAMRLRHQQQNYTHWSWMGYDRQYLETVLRKKLHIVETRGKELGDYEPHVYAEEGDEGHNFVLDAISIPEVSFDPDVNLDNRFSDLASVCMPSANTTYNTSRTTRRTALIQVGSHETKPSEYSL